MRVKGVRVKKFPLFSEREKQKDDVRPEIRNEGRSAVDLSRRRSSPEARSFVEC